jgi:5-methylcytosine-specific restriction endonuclease McrA
MWQRRIHSRKRNSHGIASIRRDSYNSVNGFTQKGAWWEIRAKVMKRANGKCEALLPNGRRCLAPATECHHIRPLSKGGTTTMANLLAICQDCHNRRHTHLMKSRG